MQPQFPLYIPSKGRAHLCITMKELDRINVPYRVVVEQHQFADYERALGKQKLLMLDPQYQHDYDAFDDLGMTRSKGPGPARNFIWDHAISEGHAWHWVMDDNIKNFYRCNKNLILKVDDGTIFACMEEFAQRYTNLAMVGPNYEMFVLRREPREAMTFNTRIYSCNLIRNDLPFRWRGRYNEDTDLSLRMLKAGWCTVQFNAFLQKKLATMLVQGGNTAEFYGVDGTEAKSRMLLAMHPDITKLVWRYGRKHHLVDYRQFRNNKLLRKPGLVVPQGNDEHGMRIVQVSEVSPSFRTTSERRPSSRRLRRSARAQVRDSTAST